MTGPRSVRITANFETNLQSVQSFLVEVDAAAAFEQLLDHLLGTVIPNLERFPDMGVDFFGRQCRSIETQDRVAQLRSTYPNQSLREYIFDEYLILYSVSSGFIDLLSIRQHRQLSFDLEGIWF